MDLKIWGFSLTNPRALHCPFPSKTNSIVASNLVCKEVLVVLDYSGKRVIRVGRLHNYEERNVMMGVLIWFLRWWSIGMERRGTLAVEIHSY